MRHPIHIRQITFGAMVASLTLGGITGCQSGDAAAIKTAPVSTDDMVKRIQDDPHMPADQKAAAIARVNSHPAPTAGTGH